MKMHMRMLTLLTMAVALVACGGDGGSAGPPSYAPTGPATYPLPGASGLDLPAGSCFIVNASPVQIPTTANVAYAITDHYDDDLLEVAVVPSSDTCDFTGFVDDSITGSATDSGTVPAGTYDLDVICQNSVQDCFIDDVTWSATY
jgi:hypothetical protein